MKKQCLYAVCALLTLAVTTAQVERAGTLKISSVERDATSFTFGNVLDAASTIDESATDISFSKIGRSYFFGGIAANPNLISASTANFNPVFGYYHNGRLPWSIFAQVHYTGTSSQSVAIDDGAGTTRKPSYSAFGDLNTDLQFLINAGPFSSGLITKLYFTDSKIVDNTTNVEINSNGTVTKNVSPDFLTDVAFYVPFFFRTGTMAHYLEAGAAVKLHDQSEKETVNGTVTIDDVNISRHVIPGVYYKLSLPLGLNDNQLAVFTNLGLDVYTVKGANADNKVNYNFNAGLYYKMNFNAVGDWLKFRLIPQLMYTCASNNTGASYLIPASTTSYTNGVQANLYAGFEFRPDTWFVGFMLGSKATVAFENSNTKSTSTANVTTQVVENKWNTNVTAAAGLFFPLPQNYRLDILVSTADDNFFQFGKLAVQLIVPLK